MNESSVNSSVMSTAAPLHGHAIREGQPVTPPQPKLNSMAGVQQQPVALKRLAQTQDTDTDPQGAEEALDTAAPVESMDEDTFGADVSEGMVAQDPGAMGHESAGREDSVRYSAMHEPAMMLTAADATFLASDPPPLALAQPLTLGDSASSSAGAGAAMGSTAMGELMPVLGALAFGMVAAKAVNPDPTPSPVTTPPATGITPPLVFSISHAAGAPRVMEVNVTLPSTMSAGQTLTFSVAQGSTVLETVHYVLTPLDIAAGTITKFLGSNNLTDNNYQISVNQAGTAALAGNTQSFHLDVTPPSAPQLSLSPNGNATTVNVTLPTDAVVGDTLTLVLNDQAGSTVQTLTHAITAADLSTHTAQLTLQTGTLPPNTPYQALANLTDAAGNVSTSSTPAALTTPGAPTPGITLSQDSGIAGDQITNQAALSLSGVLPGAIVEYSLNSGPWSGSYTAPTQSGLYTVQVRQLDTQTGHLSNPGSLTFTLDTLAPAALSLALANGATNLTNSAALAALTPEVGALVEYRVDGGAWASSYTAPTSNTAHTVDVRQTDVAGNVSAPTSLAFTLDTVAPAALSLALANGATTLTNNAALAPLTPEVGASVEYRVDGGAWVTTYTAPTTQGAHTVDIRQTDAAGNVSPTSSLSFTLDTVAPAALSLALANGATTLTNSAALAAITPEAGATVEYRVDNGAWGTYIAPTTQGAHSVDVRQTDAAGNVSAPTSLAFTLDTVVPNAPVVTLVNGTTSLTNNTAVSITSEPGATIEYSTNGTTWVAQQPAAVQGINTLYVRQIDAAGNISAASTPLTFNLDSVAPNALTLALANGATTLTNNATLAAITPEAGATVEYRVDNGAWGTYVAPTTQGAHTVDVRQTDAAGNISPLSSLAFTLDTVAPAAPSLVLSGTQNAVGGIVTNSTIDLVGVEANAAVQYRVYTGTTPSAWTPLVAVGGIYTVPSQPTSGLYTVDVQVTDGAGNISSLSTASFNLQGTAGPVASLVSDTGLLGDGITSNPGINIPASTTPGLTQIEYSADVNG